VRKNHNFFVVGGGGEKPTLVGLKKYIYVTKEITR
jgi:hypothetical protein